MRLSPSSLWALRLRGGEPDAAVTDDASDASDVDSWWVHNRAVNAGYGSQGRETHVVV